MLTLTVQAHVLSQTRWRFRVLWYLLLSAATFITLVVGVGATPAAGAPEDEPPEGPTVEILEISPNILRDEDEVTVTVRLSNFDADEDYARVAAFVHADPFASNEAVDRFLKEGPLDGWSAGEATLEVSDLGMAASPGGVEFDLVLETRGLPLWNPEAWGPYGVVIRVLGLRSTESTGYVPQDQTLLLWYPPGASGHADVNVLLSQETVEPLSTDPTLFARSGVAVVLTPEQLHALSRKGRAQSVTEVVLTPPFGADLAMLGSLGQENLYRLASETRKSAIRYLEEEGDLHAFVVVDKVLLGNSEWLTGNLLKQAGANTVLSGPHGVPTLMTWPPTPSALFLVDSGTGETVGSVEDQSPWAFDEADEEDDKEENLRSHLTPVLDSWNAGVEVMTEDANVVTSNEFTQLQKIRAATALIVTGNSEEQLSAWLNVPLHSLPPNFDRRLDALYDTPWTNEVSLQRMLESDPSSVPRMPLINRYPAGGSNLKRELTALTDAYISANDVAEATADSEQIMGTLNELTLSALSMGLSESERSAALEEAMQALEEAANIVSIAPTQTVNVMGKNAPFPVTVTNDGGEALDVYVSLEPGDSRLQAPQGVRAVVPAEGNVSVHIPVVAVGTGNLEVVAKALSPTGAVLSTSPGIEVRLLADWGDTLTWAIGGVLALLFVYGLFRTVRKGRRKVVLAARGGRYE